MLGLSVSVQDLLLPGLMMGSLVVVVLAMFAARGVRRRRRLTRRLDQIRLQRL
jgi:hypothetical protein